MGFLAQFCQSQETKRFETRDFMKVLKALLKNFLHLECLGLSRSLGKGYFACSQVSGAREKEHFRGAGAERVLFT